MPFQVLYSAIPQIKKEKKIMPEQLDVVMTALESKKKTTKKGGDYWMARDIQGVLGYSRWENFEKIVRKALMSCESVGADPVNHFRESTKMVEVGSGAMVSTQDYFLTRYACYLIAMNGDVSKPEIATAQAYFAVQTRKQEIQEQLTTEERRVQLRERVRIANKSLASTAKQAGVIRYAIFQAAGYKGLYEMGLSEVKRVKGIGQHEDLLDRAGRTELAANEFRITQTEEKLMREKVNSEQQAIQTHEYVGREVRAAIGKLGGRMPEKLPPEPSIKKIQGKLRKQLPSGERP
jgi:DNA-damage-inducible protein D